MFKHVKTTTVLITYEYILIFINYCTKCNMPICISTIIVLYAFKISKNHSEIVICSIIFNYVVKKSVPIFVKSYVTDKYKKKQQYAGNRNITLFYFIVYYVHTLCSIDNSIFLFSFIFILRYLRLHKNWIFLRL